MRYHRRMEKSGGRPAGPGAGKTDVALREALARLAERHQALQAEFARLLRDPRAAAAAIERTQREVNRLAARQAQLVAEIEQPLPALRHSQGVPGVQRVAAADHLGLTTRHRLFNQVQLAGNRADHTLFIAWRGPAASQGKNYQRKGAKQAKAPSFHLQFVSA